MIMIDSLAPVQFYMLLATMCLMHLIRIIVSIGLSQPLCVKYMIACYRAFAP